MLERMLEHRGAPGQSLAEQVDWQPIFSALFREPMLQTLLGSGLLLAVGLLGRYLQATWRLGYGERPDFFAPLLRLVLFFVLLASYQRLCLTLVQGVAALGERMLRDVSMEAVWQQRYLLYQKHVDALGEAQQAPQLLNRANYLNGTLELAAHLGLLASQAAIVGLRTMQVFFLMGLFLAGPWMFALAFLGGPFGGLARSWLVGVIEVGSWSWGLRVLAFSMARVGELTGRQAYTYSREISSSFVTVALVLAVPVLMRRLWRSAQLRH